MTQQFKPVFRIHLLAAAACAALAAPASWALDLLESPPQTIRPYVAPNVIISLDDSGSMRNTDGNAQGDTRIQVLKDSLTDVFGDTELLPEGKIRLAWQIMHNNGGYSGAADVNNNKKNAMRILTDTHDGTIGHRQEFLNFVNGINHNGWTPSHRMLYQADKYMRSAPGINSPWAYDPGKQEKPYLACRRSYHIFMTDGEWNRTSNANGTLIDPRKNLAVGPDTSILNYDGQEHPLPDLVHTYDPDSDQTRVYSDDAGILTTLNNRSVDDQRATLADWALKSWAENLQADYPNHMDYDPNDPAKRVEPGSEYKNAPATENIGGVALEKYWNPKYNPATWPHMVTYTIGLSTAAVNWTNNDNNNISPPTEKAPFGYDGSFPDLVAGNLSWPVMNTENRARMDLWHAAINGRGRYYGVQNGEDLAKAFREIIEKINKDNAADGGTSIAASSSNATRSDVGLFTSVYKPAENWKGYIEQSQIDASSADPDAGSGSSYSWSGQNTADKLDAMNPNNRLILSWDDTQTSQGGIAFEWSTSTPLNAMQQLWLQRDEHGHNSGPGAGQNRLNFLRGHRSLEGDEFRQRSSIQGDIINSSVWHTGSPSGNIGLNGYQSFVSNHKNRTPMLYVGGNDGMLHGFSAKDGSEKIAYVPKGLYPKLSVLTTLGYDENHRAFVDASPMTGDVNIAGNSSPDWRTVLVGALGAGGKGFFVLDVTNPGGASSSAPSFDSNNASSLVMVDRTQSPVTQNCDDASLTPNAKNACLAIESARDANDDDIGYMTADPVTADNDNARSTQITRLNNGRWAAIMGNGYNSKNQRPVLLIQYLDGSRELQTLPATQDAVGTGHAIDNGLSAPRVVDLDGDGMADIVYAGDNRGNLWKFDLTSSSENSWNVAFGGQPLFTAQDSAGNPQPISTPPLARANNEKMIINKGTSDEAIVPVGGMMVAFGTGRNVAHGDAENEAGQTLYSVLDNTRYEYSSTGHLKVATGGGTCPGVNCVPTPQPLGVGAATARLAQQKITSVTGTGDRIDVVDELDEDSWPDYNGWYLELPQTGERVLKPLQFYDGSDIMTVWSQRPARFSDIEENEESCKPANLSDEVQWRTLINMISGKRPRVQLVDYNGDNSYNTDDQDISRRQVAAGGHSLVTQDDRIIDVNAEGEQEKLARIPIMSLRPSWQQMK